LKNVRLPNISVVPVDPDHFFKPKLAARFGRRTLEVRSALSWLDCGKAMISPLARDLWLGVGRWGNTSWRCLCYALAAAYGSRAELADAILGRYRAATAKKLAKLPSYRISPAKSSGFIAMNDCDHEAKGQTHNRVSSHSAPKHVLFAVCHFAARGISVSTRAQERSGGRAYGDSLGKIPRELSWCHRSRGVLRDLIPFLTGSSRASNV
jgi:hypothetical protein